MTHVNSWRGGKPRPKRRTMIPQRTLTGWEENRMRDRETICLTPGINLKDYTIVSYLCGTRLDSIKGMNWSYFDFASLINSSTNPIDKTTGYHFTATRKRGDKEAEITVVVAIKNKV